MPFFVLVPWIIFLKWESTYLHSRTDVRLGIAQSNDVKKWKRNSLHFRLEGLSGIRRVYSFLCWVAHPIFPKDFKIPFSKQSTYDHWQKWQPGAISVSCLTRPQWPSWLGLCGHVFQALFILFSKPDTLCLSENYKTVNSQYYTNWTK